MALTNRTIKVDSDVVKTEGHNRISRDEDVLASGSGVVQCGTVLGQVTASGKFAPLAPAASDGTQNAVKVILETADATSADVRVVTLARHSEVVLQGLLHQRQDPQAAPLHRRLAVDERLLAEAVG